MWRDATLDVHPRVLQLPREGPIAQIPTALHNLRKYLFSRYVDEYLPARANAIDARKKTPTSLGIFCRLSHESRVFCNVASDCFHKQIHFRTGQRRNFLEISVERETRINFRTLIIQNWNLLFGRVGREKVDETIRISRQTDNQIENR